MAPGLDLYEDVFDPRIVSLVLATARGWYRDGTFQRSNSDWHPSLVRASAKVLIRDFGGSIAETILALLNQRRIIESRSYSLSLYAWLPGSYIGWHNDGCHAVAVTVYLNERWDRDWGGLFLYEDEDRAIRAVTPRFNLGLRNSANLRHATTPVMGDAAEPRYTLQLFPTPPAA